jgi:membrane-bound metal-dependent hydrolase YbcI (DUF457 family)
MTTITHTLVGAAIAKAALSGHAIHADPTLVYTVSILAANLPDINVPFIGLRRSFYRNHRLSACHLPLFWIALFLIIQILLPDHTWKTILPYAAIGIVNIFLHFILDLFSLHNGVCLLAPFLKREYSITRLKDRPETIRLYLRTYTKSVLFKGELLGSLFLLGYLLTKPF